MKLATLKPRVHALPDRLPTAGYDTTQRDRGRPWRRRRAAWLQLHPFCAACTGRGHVTPATEVDHVIPLWQGGADNDRNYQSLCKPDHDAKTARESKIRVGGG